MKSQWCELLGVPRVPVRDCGLGVTRFIIAALSVYNNGNMEHIYQEILGTFHAMTQPRYLMGAEFGLPGAGWDGAIPELVSRARVGLRHT